MKMISAGKIVSVELMSMLLAVLCVPSSSLVHAAAYVHSANDGRRIERAERRSGTTGAGEKGGGWTRRSVI